LLALVSKIPVVGKKIKPVLDAVKDFKTSFNKPFEITEFDKEKQRKKESAPNTAEMQSKQSLNVFGTIGVQGPPGTTVKRDKKTTPGVDFSLLGAS
jgi:hypothetical protein